MNNYMNPFSLIKENYLEATTFTEKVFTVVIGAWITLLSILAVTGIGKVIYELITDPTQFSNVTWGIFDTLG